MAQPDTRKYQLFPKENQSAASPVRVLAPEEAFALAMGQTTDKADKSNAGGFRFRLKDHTPPVPVRRRKVSVPELGPMTTVHESSMDSPTIPGRPVLHERSSSVPGNNGWRHLNFNFKHSANKSESSDAPNATRPPSPKDLPPLTIPSNMSSSPLKRQLSTGRLRSCGTNKDSSRSARSEDSPKCRTPYTPLSASQQSFSSTPGSATTTFSAMSSSTMSTTVSAIPEEGGESPRSWRADSQTPTSEAATDTFTPTAAVESRSGSSAGSHKRQMSEGGSNIGGIMDRGRHKKAPSEGVKRSDSKKTKSAERRAFETLPQGWRVPEAMTKLETSETLALNKQALQQAGRFEVLRKTDVDSLSRELRNLDERCEYLRRTYHSLRAGRRNLHSRICSYLRSPRMVKFSQESLLKQEEALAELDSSIDDWVNKLEQAENRRTRVRQKLLEHVAAAAILPIGIMSDFQAALNMKAANTPACPSTPPRSPARSPSRSPVAKSSFTSQPGSTSPIAQQVVAQVPSTIIEQPVVEEAASVGLGIAPDSEPATVAGIRRAEVESIRIYAGDEVAALLADVEQEITRMSQASERNAAQRMRHAAVLFRERKAEVADKAATAGLSEQEHRELHRARSAEALQAEPKAHPSTTSLRTLDGSSSTPTLSTPKATIPAATEKVDDHSNFMLSSAVFNPKAAIVH